MWLGIDPLWEKYAGMNPYNYCAGNPVRLVDVDGRSIEEGKKEWDSMRKEIEAKRDEIRNLRLSNTDLKRSELRRLHKREILLNQKLMDMTDLERSEQKYNVKKIDGLVGSVSKNVTTGVIDINYISIENFVHETTHATQYEKGDMGFNRTNGQAVLKDVFDEISAYKFELAFSGVQSIDNVTVEWISNMVDPQTREPLYAGYASVPINRHSTFSDLQNGYPNEPNISFLRITNGNDKSVVEFFNYDVK